jgi:hypothetical protein
MIFDLVIQIFMAASLIAGITMIVFTLGYRRRLRRIEVYGRCTLGFLLVYSVTVRFLLLMPEIFAYAKECSIGFDVFYVALCLFYNINITSRRNNGRKRENRNPNKRKSI